MQVLMILTKFTSFLPSVVMEKWPLKSGVAKKIAIIKLSGV